MGLRRYFPQTFDPNEEHVLLKEMRFRVRHIVVCLLLQKRDEARGATGGAGGACGALCCKSAGAGFPPIVQLAARYTGQQ